MIKYKYIIFFLTYKNLQVKYKHTILGFLWSLLHPFLYLLIFLIIFKNAFPLIHNYPLYVLSGIIFWTYFSGGVSLLCVVFVKNSHLLKSLGIPKSIYPLSDLSSELVSFFLGLIPFLAIMFFMGLIPSFNLLYLIPVILLFSIFIFSVGLIMGSINVFFRDVNFLWLTLNPALFFFTPIAYSYTLLPEKYNFIVKLNPLYHFLEIARDVLYYNQTPSLHYFVNCLIITTVSLLLSLIIFRMSKNSFISYL